MEPTVRVSRLDNGLRVVTESVRDVSSVALGLWVENGSRYESQELNGVSHFIEHLLFKGTPTRSAFAIAEQIEGVGGSIDAFTTKEYTCFHTRTLAAHLGLSLDLLADIFLNSCFRPDDLELERDVIIHEILDADAVPEDCIHDYYMKSWWPGHPLGWPVAGTVDSVSTIGRDDLLACVRDAFRADRVVVAAAGALGHEELLDMCREAFQPLHVGHSTLKRDKPDFNPGLFVCSRDIEQVHILAGLPGLSVTDPRRETAELMIAALGGGMSSRLFQSVREQRGKSYSVYAFLNPFSDIGYTGIYASTNRADVAEVIGLITDELRELRRTGLKPEELERTRTQLIGGIPLSLESTDSRMFRIAKNQLYFGEEIPVSKVVEDIGSVTNDDIVELAQDMFAFERMGVALLGDADPGMLSLPVS